MRALLVAIGRDPNDRHLAETPRRVASALDELLTPTEFAPTTFPNDGGYDELVISRDIPFHSLCEHHLLPWIGKAHVAYIPNGDGRVTGLSKLARLVEGYARRPQVQERLTSQIADTLEATLQPKGVMVVIEAEHLCMSMRGVRKPGSKTITSAVRGMMHNPATRAEAMSLIASR